MRCDLCGRLIGMLERLVAVSAAAVWDDTTDSSGVFKVHTVHVCSHCERLAQKGEELPA